MDVKTSIPQIEKLSRSIKIFLIVIMVLKVLPYGLSYPKALYEPKFETLDINETLELNIPMPEEYQDDHRYRREISTEPNFDYDYDKFWKEYYAENPRDLSENNLDASKASTKKFADKSPTEKPKIATMENYCSVFLYVRTRVFPCLHYAITHDDTELKHRCRNVLIFWTIVYIVLATYLWCTHGWCCCCFSWVWWCRPYQVMRKAKHILATEPPGVDTQNGVRVNYMPTEHEKKCYSRLEEIVFY